MGRRDGHGGHHGGTWKVAYADFVTAMMSLFIVLWILGANEEMKASIAAYFHNPGIFHRGEGKGYLNNQGVIELKETLDRLRQEQSADSVAAVEASLLKLGLDDGGTDPTTDRGTLNRSADQLREEIERTEILRDLAGQVTIEFTAQGMRIQMEDLSRRPLFALGSAHPTPAGRELLRAVGRVLAPLPNGILLEGHTDSRPYSGASTYSNWELSGDRANAARRVLEETGIDPTRMLRVIGHADRQLLVPEEPFSDRNRRISITVAYTGGRLS